MDVKILLVGITSGRCFRRLYTISEVRTGNMEAQIKFLASRISVNVFEPSGTNQNVGAYCASIHVANLHKRIYTQSVISVL